MFESELPPTVSSLELGLDIMHSGITPSMFFDRLTAFFCRLEYICHIPLFVVHTIRFPLVTLADALTKFLQQNFDFPLAAEYLLPFRFSRLVRGFGSFLRGHSGHLCLSFVKHSAGSISVHRSLQFQALVRGFFIVFECLFAGSHWGAPSFLTSYFPLMTDVQRVLRAD